MKAWEEWRAILHRTIKGQVLGSFFPVIYRVAQKLHDRWSALPKGAPIAIMADLQEMNLMAILLSCFTMAGVAEVFKTMGKYLNIMTHVGAISVRDTNIATLSQCIVYIAHIVAIANID